MRKIVIVVRHGEKAKDSNGTEVLTTAGIEQIKKTCKRLTRLGAPLKKIFYSGEIRTLQCATLAQDILNFQGIPEVHSGFHPGKLFEGIDMKAFEAEHQAIVDIGNTIEAGLQISSYVRQARAQLTGAIINCAEDGMIVAFSHSPFSSLASPNISLPYEIGLADAFIYTVEEDRIISVNHSKNATEDYPEVFPAG